MIFLNCLFSLQGTYPVQILGDNSSISPEFPNGPLEIWRERDVEIHGNGDVQHEKTREIKVSRSILNHVADAES